MTQQAQIVGDVTYREGDGVPIPVPKGPVDITAADDSVTLSWTADNDAAGSAALPRDQFDEYVSSRKIVLSQPLVIEPHTPV